MQAPTVRLPSLLGECDDLRPQDMAAVELTAAFATVSSQHLGGVTMAQRTVFVSDLSGQEIADGKGAKIRITFADARKGSAELDVTDTEAEQLAVRAERLPAAGGGLKPQQPTTHSGLDVT